MLESTISRLPERDQIEIRGLFDKYAERNSPKNQAIAALVIIAIAVILGPILEIGEREKPVNSSPAATTIFTAHPPTLTTLPK
ncbi:MAG TPA: hypothetical protein DEF27_03440 [Oscillatoriales bacterium UBA8482]|nr:MAG: hypothetical protein COW87_01315 [Candidatus Levybacteria bacterium CG22_combo_CG10-13_8_21_14_all_35_11]PJA91562.1 MAG: hypothetical protein CO135_00655 [Candidatus Levybacteria bacterium CG_4_9_14_3_um_filter_35_16]HBW56888.1 hypothetical protein [Oscillatoriales bacterium UBA8482]